MIPAIKRLYPLKEIRLRRSGDTWCSSIPRQPYVPGHRRHCRHGRGAGQRRGNYDGTINGIKVGLMGPLAGVGIHWSGERCARLPPRSAHLWHFGQHSRPAAVLLYFQRGASAMKWYGLQLGFRKGVNIVSDWAVICCKNSPKARRFSDCLCGRAGDQMDVNQRTVGGFTNDAADGSTVTMTVQNILDQLCLVCWRSV